MTYYSRNLPHWRQEGAKYFVTFRLHDSLPQSQLRELKMMREEWEWKHPEPRSDDAWAKLAELQDRAEEWMDQGKGCCVLRDKHAAAILTDALHFFDGERYELNPRSAGLTSQECPLWLRPDWELLGWKFENMGR
jgi:hypothetical protein